MPSQYWNNVEEPNSLTSQQAAASIFLFMNLLSSVSQMIIIFVYITKPRFRTYAFSLNICLIFTSFLHNFKNVTLFAYFLIISDDPDTQQEYVFTAGTCRFYDGVFNMTLFISHLIQICIITYQAHSILMGNQISPENEEDPIRYYAPYTFILPLCISIIPMLTDNYQPRGPLIRARCQFNVTNGQEDYQIVFTYLEEFICRIIPVLGTMVVIIYYSRQIYLKIKSLDGQIKLTTKIKITLIMYPVAVLIGDFWYVISAIIHFCGVEASFGIYIVMYSIMYSQGLINAFVFGFYSLQYSMNFKLKDICSFKKEKTFEEEYPEDDGIPQSDEIQNPLLEDNPIKEEEQFDLIKSIMLKGSQFKKYNQSFKLYQSLKDQKDQKDNKSFIKNN